VGDRFQSLVRRCPHDTVMAQQAAHWAFDPNGGEMHADTFVRAAIERDPGKSVGAVLSAFG
jgi:hypothetical protein